MNSKERLSGLVITVIALMFVLAGAAGFVFWQNFDRSKKEISIAETKRDEDIVEETTDKSSAEKPVNVPASKPKVSQAEIGSISQPEKTGKENFEITQWGVKGYYGGSYSISYEVDKDGNLGFSSDDLGIACADYSVASIKRRKGDQLISTVTPFRAEQSENMTVAEAFAKSYSSANSSIHIGEYYYHIFSPQSPCGTPDKLSLDIYYAIEEYFNTLVAV